MTAWQALDEALRRGWQFHVNGGQAGLVTVRVFRPRQAFPWTTIYSTKGALDALDRAGETVREAING